MSSIKSTRIKHPGAHLDLMESTYVKKDGTEGTWEWAQRKGKQNAVVIVAVVEDGGAVEKMVVTKEFRVPLGDYEWGLPAGLINNGETPEEAARREFHEETGMNITQIDNISPLVYNTAGMTDEGCYIVFCSATGTPDASLQESTEDIVTELYSTAAIQDLMRDKDVKIAAKAYLAFLLFVAASKK